MESLTIEERNALIELLAILNHSCTPDTRRLGNFVIQVNITVSTKERKSLKTVFNKLLK